MFFPKDQALPINTWRGLTQYLATREPRPPALSPNEYTALTPSAQEEYNLARSRHLPNILVLTPPVRTAIKWTYDTVRFNIGRTTDRRGVMISGYGGSGKTSTAKAVMTAVYKAYEAQYPEVRHDPSTLPIVYLEVPPYSNGKRLIQAFAKFFELTYTESEPTAALTERVVSALRHAGTQLIVVDELHNLNASNRGHAESIDVLRQLQRTIWATFVYAGVELTQGTVFSGLGGGQITARTGAVELRPFPYQTDDDKALWGGIIEAIERQLPLFAHQAGTLVKLGRYLHTETGGEIGTLGGLIYGAASATIWNGNPDEEKITRELLDTQMRDLRAQTRIDRLAKLNTSNKASTRIETR